MSVGACNCYRGLHSFDRCMSWAESSPKPGCTPEMSFRIRTWHQLTFGDSPVSTKCGVQENQCVFC